MRPFRASLKVRRSLKFDKERVDKTQEDLYEILPLNKTEIRELVNLKQSVRNNLINTMQHISRFMSLQGFCRQNLIFWSCFHGIFAVLFQDAGEGIHYLEH